MQGQLTEFARIESVIVPINTTGAAQTGAWVGMKFWKRCCIIIQAGAWAGGTAAVTLSQASDSTGTGAKALAFANNYSWSSTSDTVTKNTVSSNTFNVSAANQIFAIEITSYDLDLANGFSYLRVNTASPGANADLISALCIMYDPAYAAVPTSLPSALT